MDDDELRRKELFRLLETTSTVARRSIVQKAIEDLNSIGSFLSIPDTPFVPETMGAVEKLRASSSASSFRPFSAVRERRPSVGILDMIPEKRAIATARNNVALALAKGIDVSLSKLDVLESYSSSESSNHRILDVFIKHKCWISTGLFPQIITFRFIKKWVFRRIELRCSGASNVYYSTNNNINECVVSCINMKSMYSENNHFYSIDLSTDIINNTSNSILAAKSNDDNIEESSGMFEGHSNASDSFILRIENGNDNFIVMYDLSIRALQH